PWCSRTGDASRPCVLHHSAYSGPGWWKMVEVVSARCRQWGRRATRQPFGDSCGKPCELFQPHLDGAAAALAPSDDEDGIVTGDGADDFRPAGAVERQGQ